MDIIVVGGGAAGCMAALTAARAGASVALVERNPKLGRKLYITGKGRCNLTNDCTAEEAVKNVTCNGRFLISALTRFPPAATKAFFEGLGVPLKTERGARVFPVSDRAADIVDALLHALRRAGVDIVEARAQGLVVEGGRLAAVRTTVGRMNCKALILATGGLSYPLTGSTGDGYRLAQEVGHGLVPPRASLVPLEVEQPFCARLQGLSLRNVAFQVKEQGGKTVFREQGELLFTHFGVSGPLVLSASAHMRGADERRYTGYIDMKPALDEKTLDERLLRDLSAGPNKSLQTILEGLVPHAMAPVFAEILGIPAATRAHSVTREQRRALLGLLKQLRLDIRGTRGVEEAVVTAGGVPVSEVDPKTMASRLVPGLYFAGEILDVDAYTGGFNLQIAWASGHAAGESAAAALHKAP